MAKVKTTLEENHFLVRVNIYGKKDKCESIFGLIDTGAMTSLVSTRVIEKLNLENRNIMRDVTVISAFDTQQRPRYKVSCGIFANSIIPMVGDNVGTLRTQSFIKRVINAIEGDITSTQGIDMIIGMDILRDFHISYVDGVMTLSI